MSETLAFLAQADLTPIQATKLNVYVARFVQFNGLTAAHEAYVSSLAEAEGDGDE